MMIQRMANYPLEYAASYASTLAVDKILQSDFPKRVLDRYGNETWEQILIADLGVQNKGTHQIQEIPFNPAGIAQAVAILRPYNADVSDWSTHEQELIKRLVRVYSRTSDLMLFTGTETDASGQVVRTFYIVVDDQNQEFIVTADGVTGSDP